MNLYVDRKAEELFSFPYHKTYKVIEKQQQNNNNDRKNELVDTIDA